MATLDYTKGDNQVISTEELTSSIYSEGQNGCEQRQSG